MVMVGLLLIGTVWGATNALIKRGALIAQERERDRKRKEAASQSQPSGVAAAAAAAPLPWLLRFAKDWVHLLCVWEYSIPFLVNLSASVLFFRALGDSPINVAVPVTNATTFAVTALAGAALGERIHIWKAMIGICMIVVGITLCMVPGIIL